MFPTILPTYSRTPLSFSRGEGCWLIAEDGTRYLDFTAGIAVNALGHAHPALVAALTAQAGRLWHVSNLYKIAEQQALADALVAATFADTVFFTNSGTECCELAVKMARRHFYAKGQPERAEILTFEGAFHGRSIAAISAAGGEKLSVGFGPLLPGFVHLPFGDHEALRAAIGPRTAAILVEPVQGEGGIRPLPAACLQGLREMADAHGLLLIFDEVQCGMGRTGRLFAHEWAGVVPDIMMVAKGIGGGFPLGAVLASQHAAEGMGAGTHGSTYGGNPLGCAVGLEVMRHVATPEFLANVVRSGADLRARLEAVVADHPALFECVRGAGLMLGLKCRVPAADVVAACRAQHLLCVPASDNVVRMLPPLIVGELEITEAVARLQAAAVALATKS